ncbi:hypothetical protein [Pseudomonas arsenicoxydans]|uniref:hypothetical protein n=1 Tax=Pseudomonas arsenicoxydans TaxID=702115 RepID=UPI00195FA731|nr:hypothetical protein [Pseudomonas arsenicoxydans]
MAEQFAAEVRVTGIALPYALSVTLFGGTALYLMAAMAGWGYGGFFWIYLVVISAISEVVYLRMPETRGSRYVDRILLKRGQMDPPFFVAETPDTDVTPI